MKKRKALLFGIILLGTLNLRAQVTPAWTRHLSPARFKEISHKALLYSTKGQPLFLDLSRRVATSTLVKTTDKNLLRHKVFYSGLFSKQEKDILLAPSYAQITLGKLAYLHDKHAAFYRQLSSRQTDAHHIHEKAFEKHQQILRELTGALQHYYAEQLSMTAKSSVFSKEERHNLLQTAQPIAYVLTDKELNEFASLLTIKAQKYWLERYLSTSMWKLESLLRKPTDTLSPAEFELYYRTQSRLSYFKLLEQVLEKAATKRTSAIVRYRASLPGDTQKLTDAQRGGKLLLEGTEDQTEWEDFNKLYAPYATAEALNVPYEISLQYGAHAPELLGLQEGQRLRQLDPSAYLEELQPKIENLEKELEQLRLQTPSSADFYKQFYRVHATLQIYKTLAARAQVMLHF